MLGDSTSAWHFVRSKHRSNSQPPYHYIPHRTLPSGAGIVRGLPPLRVSHGHAKARLLCAIFRSCSCSLRDFPLSLVPRHTTNLRTLSPVTGTSHGQGGITRQGLDLDPQDLVSSPQTAVTDEFPLVALSESSPRQDKVISALGCLGLLALSYDIRLLSSSIRGLSASARI
jgi:hypothetical protein